MSERRPLDEDPATKEVVDTSDHSPVPGEKVDPKDDPLGVLNSVPDPDKGLSEEEKHKLVCMLNIKRKLS